MSCCRVGMDGRGGGEKCVNEDKVKGESLPALFLSSFGRLGAKLREASDNLIWSRSYCGENPDLPVRTTKMPLDWLQPGVFK